MPLAQTDVLAPSGEMSARICGDLVTVVPNGNLCLIRSGQEWTETDGDERRTYLEEIEPGGWPATGARRTRAST